MASYIPHNDKVLDSLKLSYKGDVYEARFGSRYTQVADLGIDPLIYSTAVVIAPLTEAEKTTISDFLVTVGSSTPFLIARVEEDDLVALLVTNSYKQQKISKTDYRVSFSIVEYKFPGVTP